MAAPYCNRVELKRIGKVTEGWGDGKEDRRVGRSSKRAIVEFENGINKELKMEMVEEVGGEEGEEGEGERGGGGGEVCV
uniref:Uncharacterized protein n=1 Tax=Vespula pensylvanica TaxID=30213 RepID=A0A834K1Q6_VESPE|nr:hypothetical protein H0235_016238 [Vespula pensylvanica]